MTSPSYPTALDALANPGPTTETDDAGFELDIVIARLQNIAMAIEGKLGIGVGGPPATSAVLRRTAAGASAWGAIQTADVAAGAAGLLSSSVISAQTHPAGGVLNGLAGGSIGPIQTTGKPILVLLTLVGYGSANAYSANPVHIYMDGVSLALVGNEYGPASLYVAKAFMVVVTPAAGSHTFLAVWANTGGTAALNTNGGVLALWEARAQ